MAGPLSSAATVALRDAALPVARRLFMTATPVHLGNLADDDALDDLERLDDERRLLSMDDETVFGPVAYRLSADEAIARGLLADYQVLVVAGDEQDDPMDQALCALADAVRRHQVRRVLTFHNRVAAARRFAAAAALGQVGGVPIRAEAVDGSMSTAAIRQALSRLGDPAAGAQVTVVSSAQVLLEQLPGWTWEPLQSSDRAAIEALRSFVAWEKHIDVPARHLEGDVELGRWVLAARRRQLLGQLPPALADHLAAQPWDGDPVALIDAWQASPKVSSRNGATMMRTLADTSDAARSVSSSTPAHPGVGPSWGSGSVRRPGTCSGVTGVLTRLHH